MPAMDLPLDEVPGESGAAVPPRAPAVVLTRIRQEIDRLQDTLTNYDALNEVREQELHTLSAKLDGRRRELEAIARRIVRERDRLRKAKVELKTREEQLSRLDEIENVLGQREALLASREEAIRRSAEELRRRTAEMERQRRELARAVSGDRSAVVRVAMRAAATRIGIAAGLAIIAAVVAYVAIRPVWDVRTGWTYKDGNLAKETVQAALRDARTAGDAQQAGASGTSPLLNAERCRWSEPERGVVLATVTHTRDPEATAADIDAWGRAAMAALARRAATTQPGERGNLEARRRAIEEELSHEHTESVPVATTAPAHVEEGFQKVAELAERRQKAQDELAEARTHLVALRKANDELATTQPAVDEAVLQGALANDRELTQAQRRLAEQHDAIRSQLNAALTAVQGRFDTAINAAGALATAVEKQRESPPDDDASKDLDAIKDGVAAYKKRVEEFSTGWAAAIQNAVSGADPVREQSKLADAASAFVSATDTELAQVDQRIQALGEGGRQPAKRLVARSALSKVRQDLATAQRELTERVDDVTPSGNFRMEAAVRAAEAAAGEIQTRTQTISEQLRVQAARAAAESLAAQIKEAQHQEARLTTEIANLTSELTTSQAAVLKTSREWMNHLETVESVQAAQRREFERREELASINDRLAALRKREIETEKRFRFEAATRSRWPANIATRLGAALAAALVMFGLGFWLSSPTSPLRRTTKTAEQPDAAPAAEPKIGQAEMPSAVAGMSLDDTLTPTTGGDGA